MADVRQSRDPAKKSAVTSSLPLTELHTAVSGLASRGKRHSRVSLLDLGAPAVCNITTAIAKTPPHLDYCRGLKLCEKSRQDRCCGGAACAVAWEDGMIPAARHASHPELKRVV